MPYSMFFLFFYFLFFPTLHLPPTPYTHPPPTHTHSFSHSTFALLPHSPHSHSYTPTSHTPHTHTPTSHTTLLTPPIRSYSLIPSQFTPLHIPLALTHHNHVNLHSPSLTFTHFPIAGGEIGNVATVKPSTFTNARSAANALVLKMKWYISLLPPPPLSLYFITLLFLLHPPPPPPFYDFSLYLHLLFIYDAVRGNIYSDENFDYCNSIYPRAKLYILNIRLF